MTDDPIPEPRRFGVPGITSARPRRLSEPAATAADVLAARLGSTGTNVVTDTIKAIDAVMAQMGRYPRLPVRDGTGTQFADTQLKAATERANSRSWQGQLTWLEVLRLFVLAVDAQGPSPRASLIELAAFAMMWAGEIERTDPRYGHE